MRSSWKRQALAASAVAGLVLTGCGGNGQDDTASSGQGGQEQTADGSGGQGSGGQGSGGQNLPDPSENIEDGVYHGNGVALPVPDGWSMSPAALQQGLVAATSEDGSQQLTAQAINADQAQSGDGGSMGVDTLLENVRGQIDQEPATDQEVELAGAEQAHRLTYREVPAQQGYQGPSSTTILVASGGEGEIAQFTYRASADTYNEDIASQLVEEGGFDPDSQPPEMPQSSQGGSAQGGAQGSGSSSQGGSGQGSG